MTVFHVKTAVTVERLAPSLPVDRIWWQFVAVVAPKVIVIAIPLASATRHQATPGSSIELVDMMQQTPLIVLENGASTIKVGIVNESGTEPRCVAHPIISPYRRDKHNRLIPNSVVRSKGDKMTYFGHEMEHCRDFSSLHYRLPFEKV